MKIKVLGCSNSWTEKHTSCFLVNDNILIDCGIDAYKAYIKLGKPLTDIKLFLISHFHADHIMGLYIFLTEYVEAKNKIDKNDDTEELQLKGVVRAGCDWRTGWEQGLTILMYYEFMPTEKHL